ncbi:MAG: hypothetical protein MUF83_04925 [Acidimicrobiales bacterium]|jgi:hypothetical protein|nr:hypothetical protein [Acidimicrobiales bacterium]
MTPPNVSHIESRLTLPPELGGFSDAETDGLPEPVRAWFRAAIAPGTPLAQAAQIRMQGQIRLGGRWLPFRCREVLSPRHGFAWSGRVAGVLSGSDYYADGDGRMDWKLLGLKTVAHADGADVARSAAGRGGAEGIWVPTALLPRFGVAWSAPADDLIVARYRTGDVDLEVFVRLDDEHHVVESWFDRWGDPDETGTSASYPFGVRATGTATFDGVTIPHAGRVGWFHGTPRWQEGEFFRYRITDLRLVRASGDTMA